MKTAKKFATAYTHTQERSQQFGHEHTGESMAVQAQAHDQDVNVIMKRYKATGQLPNLTDTAQYGDFTQVGDYRTAMDAVKLANDQFAALPAAIRKEFDNDPAQMLAFVQKDENREKAEKMGLLKPKETPTISHDTAEIIRTLKENQNGDRENAADDAAGDRAQHRNGRPRKGPG